MLRGGAQTGPSVPSKPGSLLASPPRTTPSVPVSAGCRPFIRRLHGTCATAARARGLRVGQGLQARPRVRSQPLRVAAATRRGDDEARTPGGPGRGGTGSQANRPARARHVPLRSAPSRPIALPVAQTETRHSLDPGDPRARDLVSDGLRRWPCAGGQSQRHGRRAGRRGQARLDLLGRRFSCGARPPSPPTAPCTSARTTTTCTPWRARPASSCGSTAWALASRPSASALKPPAATWTRARLSAPTAPCTPAAMASTPSTRTEVYAGASPRVATWQARPPWPPMEPCTLAARTTAFMPSIRTAGGSGSSARATTWIRPRLSRRTARSTSAPTITASTP